MTKRLFTCLIACVWLSGCAEDPVSIGAGPGGTLANHLDIIPLVADTLFQEEIPLIAASQLWVGQLNEFAVTTRLLLQFFEFDTTAPWLAADTLTLDSVRLVLSHRVDGWGSFQTESHSRFKLHRVALECDNCGNLTEVVHSHLYAEDETPLFTTLDTLILTDVIPPNAEDDSLNALTTAVLPLEWLFDFDSSMVVFRDTVNLLLEMDYQFESDTTSGYLHTFNAKDGSDESWPRLEFHYHSDTENQSTLTQFVRYDTYLLQDNAIPADDELFVSVGDAWQFALRFEGIEYNWEDGVCTEELHSLATTTVHSAQIRLYPNQYTTHWRFNNASTQVWDVLTWNDAGELVVDTLVAQTSYTEGIGDSRIDINVTHLINRWLTREDYLGVLMRVSQASTNLNPARMVYHGFADTTGLQPELWIYRSSSPFQN